MNGDTYITILEKLKAYDYWPIKYNNEVITIEFDDGFILKGSIFSDKKYIPKEIIKFVKGFSSNEQGLIIDRDRNALTLSQFFEPTFTSDEFFQILDIFFSEIVSWRKFFDGLSRQDLVFYPKR
jgi:hypothetical protein